MIPSRILTKRTKPINHILHIPTRLLRIPLRILPTRHSIRRAKPRHFPRQALHGDIVCQDTEEAFKEVPERGEPVHPGLPEVREGCVGD